MDSHEVYLKAYGWFASKHWTKKNQPTLQDVQVLILQVALAHPRVVSGWITAHCNYRDAEGFLNENDIHRARIAAPPEYRRIKVNGGMK